jgi:hypothetical protein
MVLSVLFPLRTLLCVLSIVDHGAFGWSADPNEQCLEFEPTWYDYHYHALLRCLTSQVIDPELQDNEEHPFFILKKSVTGSGPTACGPARLTTSYLSVDFACLPVYLSACLPVCLSACLPA